jgi:ribose-phosphate pyrophosphokinase
VDDLIDTGGTLCNAARAVMDKGARRVVACAPHGVFSGPALQRIDESPLAEVVVTNSIPPARDGTRSAKIKYLSIARLLAEAIRRIDANDSVSSLFV